MQKISRCMKAASLAPLLLALHASGAFADTETTGNAAAAPETVEIAGARKPATIDFKKLHNVQSMLGQVLPAEPRHIDVVFQVETADKAAPRPKLYVVGDSIDEPVAVDGNGFFTLPVLTKDQLEGAALFIDARRKSGSITAKVLLRLDDRKRLAYRDFASAVREAKDAVARLPWYVRLFGLRGAKYEVASFCFKDGSGAVQVDGRELAAEPESPCVRVDFDADKAAKDADIEFKGELAYAMLDVRQDRR